MRLETSRRPEAERKLEATLKLQAAVFDIDCTLIKTGGAGLRAFDHVIQPLGPPLPDDYSPSGKTDWQIICEYYLLAHGREPLDEEREDLATAYIRRLPIEIDICMPHYHVLPGVNRLLDFFERNNVALGLGTGNLAEAARLKLEPGGLHRRFSFGGYGSDARDRGHVLQKALDRAALILGREFDPGGALFVGDTMRDINAARAVGGRVIAVATGDQSVAELDSADLAVESLEDAAVYGFLEDEFGLV
jgi:phosphoglycolate phosphatase-like HAD superfamily hydrolase